MGATDHDDIDAVHLPRPLTLREQVRWTLFGVALLVCFLALLALDHIA